MKGIQISLTGKEREKLIDAVTCYIDIMSEGIETKESLDIELNEGLGKAMFKLYKGLNGVMGYPEDYGLKNSLRKGKEYCKKDCTKCWQLPNKLASLNAERKQK